MTWCMAIWPCSVTLTILLISGALSPPLEQAAQLTENKLNVDSN